MMKLMVKCNKELVPLCAQYPSIQKNYKVPKSYTN
jgi:hypothetical protein